jgi:hypothetical protein
MPLENPERIAGLLNVVEKVTTVAPNCTYILSEAMAELHKLNEGIRRAREQEQRMPVTPDPAAAAVENTTEPAAGGEPVQGNAGPSQPLEKHIDTDTPLPEPTVENETPTLERKI